MAIAFVLSLGLVGLVGLVARRAAFLDAPGPRSSHASPTPTGAGLGMVLALLATGVLVGFDPQEARWGAVYPRIWLPALGGALVLAVVGFADDVRGLPVTPRLLAQLAAAGLLVWVLAPGAWWIGAASVLGLTWTMNAVNFMDGSNGMAGAEGVFAGALLTWVFHQGGAPGLALAAASVSAICAGFLPWNAPRARLFMGDAGSVPLGFLLGGLCLAGALGGFLSWPQALLVLAVFHVDAGLTLLRRMRLRERWYTPHRTHAYQRLVAHGWTHGRVALLYTALNVIIVAPGVMLGTLDERWAWASAAVAFMLLAVAWYAVSLKLGEDT